MYIPSEIHKNIDDKTGRKDLTFASLFRMVAGESLVECADIGVRDLNSLGLTGSNESLSSQIYYDAMQIWLGSDSIVTSTDRGNLLAKRICQGSKVSSGSPEDAYKSLTGIIGVVTIDSHAEKSNIGDNGTEDDDEFNTNLDEELGAGKVSEDKVEDSYKEEKSYTKKDLSELSRKIRGYYYSYYKGTVEELAKRYTALFSSGYEVITPAGLLCRDGICALSGNQRVVKKFNVVTSKVYRLFEQSMGFIEVENRSNVSIAGMLYNTYMSSGGSKLLYFPNKLLEFVYGRKAPDGNEQESLNTYKKHSDCNNWSRYCQQEVQKSLMGVMGSLVELYVTKNADGEDYFTEAIETGLMDYLKYVRSCLSVCLLMVDYKSVENGYEESVSSIKLRVCDPLDSLGTRNYIQDILRVAFMDASGEVPFSYEPRIEHEVCVKEYAHEFNRDISQASPLFAYTALLKLKEQGMELEWSNMILGMFEDGSILRNGTHGIDLLLKLTHWLIAGSRAGKGVMTLNILASAIAALKNTFYLDKKPDMSSLFRALCPEMFVINGGGYGAQYDTAGGTPQWSEDKVSQYLGNVPDYVLELLECGCTWNELGDLFYMRALMLVVGIIAARANGLYEDERLGGKEGITLVVDEFKNFQTSYNVVIKNMLANVPPANYDEIKRKLETAEEKGDSARVGTLTACMKKSFSVKSYYALTYLKALSNSLTTIDKLRDAGYNQIENSLSDIFVIGQHIEIGGIDNGYFADAISNGAASGRYKKEGGLGVYDKTLLSKANIDNGCFAYNLVSLKTADAFFGRNMEDGRSVYLAQTKKASKAYGRLDDKASNFAYMETFTDEKRQKIVKGLESDNISMANSCTYFKPFLILNDCKVGDVYTEGVFSRCAGPNSNKPWISREQLIRDNPNADGSFLNEAIGFIDYIRLAGCENYKSVLGKSGEIAQYVVQCLGYSGSWMEFITDLRPQYIFTIEDVMNAVSGKVVSMNNPTESKVFSEFVEVHPEVFGLSGTEGMSESCEDMPNIEDYGYACNIEDDPIAYEAEQKESYRQLFEEDAPSVYESDEDVDLFYEDVEKSEDEDLSELYGAIREGNVVDTKPAEEDFAKTMGMKSEETEEILKLFDMLKQHGIEVQVGSNGWEMNTSTTQNYEYQRMEQPKEFSGNYQYHDSVESLQDLIQLVTQDVITTFGGLERITSFKVIGGSIYVNGCCYRCKVGGMFANSLPYDVKRQMNSGNISCLFNYSEIRGMSSIRDLEFDSPTMVYDYVSPALGYGSSIGVNRFFEDFPSLQVFTLRGKRYSRSNYLNKLHEGDDEFYQPKRATAMADASERVLGNISKRSWGFTKKTVTNKDYGLAVKAVGVIAGVGAAGAGLAYVGTKVGRKAFSGIRSVAGSIKDALQETNKLR